MTRADLAETDSARQYGFMTPLAVAVTTLAAFALRLFHLDAQSLWYDEGVTVEIAQRGIAELTRWTANDIQPPLYYYIVSAWGRLAGWSEWSLRYPSVFFGTLIIPLLAAVTYALTRRRSAALLAALLAAAHPLLVYYSQEARMYATLTALGVLLAYLVVRVTSARRRRLNWLFYILAATAAIYTHYFAFFLLLALAVAFFLDQLLILPYLHMDGSDDAHKSDRSRPEIARTLTGFVIANIIVLLLYLPWMTTLITRLSVDASYYQGVLKLDEALRHIGVSFIGGETILEEQAVRLLVPYALATLALIPALIWRNARQLRTVAYAVLWLIVPVIGVLLLAYIVPKFNARYVMIALPGLLLLWAAGLAELSAFSDWNLLKGFRSPAAAVRSLFAITLTLVLFAGFLYADRNWFTDPAFTKAEWRELVQYIRADLAIQGDESADNNQVILVSGHSWPVWNYYAPDMPPLRLPDIEILDVNAILDFASSAIPLRDSLTDKQHAWLVEWQGEIVDPMNIVPLQLNLAGRTVDVNEPIWQRQLHHYSDVDANAVLVEPTAISDSSVNFGNLVYLLDYTLADNGDLLLFWQLHPDATDPIPDLHITGTTETDRGMPIFRLQDRRPATYEYPAFRWSPGQITLGRIRADDWAGPSSLPDAYRMKLGVYDAKGDLTGLDVIGAEGQPLGKHITLDLDLPVATEGPDIVNKVTFAQLVTDLYSELELSAVQAEPGELIPMEMHWYAEEEPVDDYDLLIRWRFHDTDEIIQTDQVALSTLPTHLWPDDELMRTTHELRPPIGLAPGNYWLEFGLTAPESEFIRVPFSILRSTRMFRPPPTITQLETSFGNSLQLLGVMEPVREEMHPGEQVVLTFVWRADDKPDADFTTTLQWLDEEGKIAQQADIPLPGGSSNWLSGQVELQSFFTNAPTEPGDYQLVTAVYNANETEIPRLRTEDGHDHVQIKQVSIAE